MRNFLNSSICSKFSPNFKNSECDHYQYSEDLNMNQKDWECGYCKLPGAYRCIADVTRPIPLSHSSINNFICPYLYYLTKILGIEKRPQFLGTPLKAGKLWDSVKQKHLGANIQLRSTFDQNGKVNRLGVIDEYEIDDVTVAKVRALFKAYKELEIQVYPNFQLQAKIDLKYNIVVPPSSFIPSVTMGKEIINLWQELSKQSEDERTWKFPLSITGFYDRKYPTYFCEDKLSGRPEFYLDPFFIQSQNGTYFLADPNLEYCIQEVVQFPQQKELKKGETAEEIGARIYNDVLSRPSKYFIGLDREKMMYGKKFYRGEFDLPAIEDMYKQITIELLAARWSGRFYKRFRLCNNMFPGHPCEYQTICKTGNVSETMYRIREK